jgi:ribosomal protein S27E
MSVVQEIRCSNCDAPIKFKSGEIIATCEYCGYTCVIETGKAFILEHSMILNKWNQEKVEDLVKQWMRSGFLKPRDLARSSKILDKNLMYLPFWIVPVIAKSDYKGVFDRISPPVVKEGKIDKKYNWLILARKAAEFPTREYDVPLEGKVEYDFRSIEGYAKVLNSEINEREGLELARQQILSNHDFLAKQDVDKIIEMKTDFDFGDPVYLHAPVWFITYEYKNERYNIILDGATGNTIRGDIPITKFSLF